MTSDHSTKYADAETAKIKKELEDVYRQAQRDVKKKMSDFSERHRVRSERYLKMVNRGQMTIEEYANWLQGQVFIGKQWNNKKKQIADILYNSNKTALDIITKHSFNVFAENANYQSYKLEHGAGINFGFGLYDSNTVARLIKDKPTILPPKRLKAGKDKPWNMKNIRSALTQGIIQGESTSQIANRFSKAVSGRNAKSMMVHARTAITGAQNAGRYEALLRAKEMGLDVYKEWMATLDARTRDSHAHLDGERVDVEEPFSNDLRYPGDPEGHPREVYNCRCTLVGDIDKYPSNYERYDNLNGVPIKNMTYQEWLKKKPIIPVDKIPPLSSLETDADILERAKGIIKSTGVDVKDKGISVTMNPTLNNGECIIADYVNIKDTCQYSGYNLKPNDSRPIEYRVKTAYHEAFHLSLHDKKWDAINSNFGVNSNWVNIEETLTECAAHYKMWADYKINDLLPSYPVKIVQNLPRLKQLEEFKNCKTIQDFGEMSWNNRVTNYDGKSGNWRGLSTRMKKHKINAEYYSQYSDYILKNKENLLDKLVEGGVVPERYRLSAKADLDSVLRKLNEINQLPLSDSNEGIVFYNVMAQCMQEVGIL